MTDLPSQSARETAGGNDRSVGSQFDGGEKGAVGPIPPSPASNRADPPTQIEREVPCEECGSPVGELGVAHARDLHAEIERINGSKNPGSLGHWHTPGGKVHCCEIDAVEGALAAESIRAERLAWALRKADRALLRALSDLMGYEDGRRTPIQEEVRAAAEAAWDALSEAER